jgi:hypothetical protein
MGARESKSQESSSGDQVPQALDYYQLLQVDESATSDEIKVIVLVTI